MLQAMNRADAEGQVSAERAAPLPKPLTPGPAMRADVESNSLSVRGRIAEIHFRNVSSPMPRFEETLPDDGYMDLGEVMVALRKVGFNGAVLPDHFPQFVDDTRSRSGLAYCVAYMRALLRQACREVG